MSWIIAALLLPVPIIHLWLHALLPWWRRNPWLFYFFGSLLWLGSFAVVPKIEQISPLAFAPSQELKTLGLILIGLGLLGVLSSLLTLGFRRFFLWAVLKPDAVPPLKIENGPFRFVPHPAYLGSLLVALGNFLTSGKFYLIGILAWLLILTPIVIWLEEAELHKRTAQ